MTGCCGYCGRPMAPRTGEAIGPVRFCSRDHIVQWFSLPRHDRRHTPRRVKVERRAS